MNFIKAMKVVDAGGLVRRRGSDWRSVEGRGTKRVVSISYIGKDEEGLYYQSGLPSAGFTVTSAPYFSMPDFLATDWVTVNPEKP